MIKCKVSFLIDVYVAVTNTWLAYYELFIENVQCRHIILGLGDDSEYFATLDMYSEDAFTLSKTSLLKTVHGFPAKYNLPFHQVEFSAIGAVPLISFNADQPREESSASASKNSSDVSHGSQPAPILDSSAHSHLPEKDRSSSASSRSQREGSGNEKLPSLPSSHTSNPSPVPSKASVASKPQCRHSQPKSAVKYPPEPSTYSETKASYEQDWERSYGVNSYAPPPCTTPWGQDQDIRANMDDPFNPPAREDYNPPSRSYATASAPKRYERPNPPPTNRHNDLSRRGGPTSFRGTWDDLVSGKPEAPVSAPQSPSTRFTGPAKTDMPLQGDVATNRFGDRVDLPLPFVSKQDRNRLKVRIKDRKLCNEHHLRRTCQNQQCRYDHEPVDAGLLLALRHLARTQACDVGSTCRMHDCCFGHNCPYKMGGRECKNANCSFKKMSLHHIRDLKVAEVIPAPRS